MAEINPPTINKKSDISSAFASWEVPEYDRYERPKIWYIMAMIILLLGLIFTFWVQNYLFAIIIVLISLIVMINNWREPENINFAIYDEGISLGKRFIDYNELKNFAIIYKPRQNIKKLYFEFESALRPSLSIYLGDISPLKIREYLLNYLQEDLERESESFSEALARLLKI